MITYGVDLSNGIIYPAERSGNLILTIRIITHATFSVVTTVEPVSKDTAAFQRKVA